MVLVQALQVMHPSGRRPVARCHTCSCRESSSCSHSHPNFRTKSSSQSNSPCQCRSHSRPQAQRGRVFCHTWCCRTRQPCRTGTQFCLPQLRPTLAVWRLKPSASNFLRDLEHNPSVWSTTNNLRPECAGRTLLGNLDSSTKSKIDRALGDFGGIDGMLSGRGMGTPSGSSSNSSVSTSTKVVNGRKQSTKVEMKNGVETIEVTEDGRLVSRTVNGRKVT